MRWVKEQQHYSWTEGSDNSTETVMIYHPRSFEQIEGWLLSWGDKVEVLEPPALRERLAAVATKIQSRYQAEW